MAHSRRWLLVSGLLAVAIAVPAAAQRGAKVIDRATRKFDHAAHDALIASKGRGKTGKNPDCNGACHTPKGAGWKQTRSAEHDRCVGCHTFTRNRKELNSGRFNWCFACHQGGAGMPENAPRQEKIAKSHATVYSHRVHIRPGAKSGKQCEACHGTFGEGEPRKGPGVLAAGHDFCSACHERVAEPSMTECAGCHVKATSERGKAPVARPRGSNPFAVKAMFDHQKHAGEKRVGSAGKECLSCHGNIAQAADDASVPLPTMKSCYDSCHNGKDGFDATGTTCTRCHAPATASRRGAR